MLHLPVNKRQRRTERPAFVTPPEVGVFFDCGLAQQQDQDDQRNRYSDQPKQNGHLISFQI